MMFSLPILVLFLSLWSLSTRGAFVSASPQKSVDEVDPSTTNDVRAKSPNKSKSAKSPYGIPSVSKDSSGQTDTSTTSKMASPDDDKFPKGASEWDLHHNETSVEDMLYDMSAKINSTLVLPAEPDTTQSSTLVVLSIFSFLALALCAATALQHLSKRGARRHEYQEVGNIVV